MITNRKKFERSSFAIFYGKGLSVAACAVACAAVSTPAFAAGTLAGTDIDNIAQATYDTPSGTVTIQSNMVRIKVDELLDVVIATNTADVITSPGATGNLQTFRVTNTGNGQEAFRLTANVNPGGDDFDPTLTKIVIDDGDGIYEPGQDADYVAGSNDPLLQPDETRVVFVITSTPVAVTNGNRGITNLIAVAITGSGAPGTTFAGAGQGGGNAVVGNSGADADASSFLAVQAAALALVKSATIVDPLGGNRPIPGAVITYSLVATISGAGSLNNLVIADPIPAGTTYQTGSITLEAATQTDAADTDAGSFDGSRVSISVGNVAAGQTRTVTFRTVIQP